jgi:hypothetical protein
MRPSPALPQRGLRLVAGVGAGGDGAHLILGVTTLEQPRSHSQDRSARQFLSGQTATGFNATLGRNGCRVPGLLAERCCERAFWHLGCILPPSPFAILAHPALALFCPCS